MKGGLHTKVHQAASLTLNAIKQFCNIVVKQASGCETRRSAAYPSRMPSPNRLPSWCSLGSRLLIHMRKTRSSRGVSLSSVSHCMKLSCSFLCAAAACTTPLPPQTLDSSHSSSQVHCSITEISLDSISSTNGQVTNPVEQHVLTHNGPVDSRHCSLVQSNA